MPARVNKSSFQRVLAGILRQDIQQAAVGGKSRGHKWLAKGERSLLKLDFAREAAAELHQNSQGNWVSVDDVMDAAMPKAMTALQQVNQFKGPGRLLVSRKEVKAMGENDPTLGPLALLAYEMVRKGPASYRSAQELASKLADYTGGYSTAPTSLAFEQFGSESDEPFQTVFIAGPGHSTATRAALASAIGFESDDLEADFEMFTAPDELLQQIIDTHKDMDKGWSGKQDWYAGPKAPHAEAFRDLILSLESPTVAVLYADDGSVAEHPVYIVGTTADGSVVGLKSVLVWT